MFYLYGCNSLELYKVILKCMIIISVIIVTVCVFQVIRFLSFFNILNIISNSKVKSFVFLIEFNLCIIRLMTYFRCTHLHTASLSFIVLLMRFNINGDSKVRTVTFFNKWNVCMIRFMTYLLMHSHLYFITRVHCFFYSIEHTW